MCADIAVSGSFFSSLYLLFNLLMCVLLLFVNVLNYCTLYCIVFIFLFQICRKFSAKVSFLSVNVFSINSSFLPNVLC